LHEILLLLSVDVGQHVPAAGHGAGHQEAVPSALGPEGQVMSMPRDRHEVRKSSAVRADDRVRSGLKKSVEWLNGCDKTAEQFLDHFA
jgi:hypothetical protein